jgi:nucleotide-binding universal stress UspA family protein
MVRSKEVAMFQHLVVPIDGSPASWASVPIAARFASAVDGKLDVVTVVDRLADVAPAQNDLSEGLKGLAALPVEPAAHVLASDSVARAVANHVESMSGATIVMSSHGHGRSAAVLGSTADELLRLVYGPLVVIGPHVSADAGSLDGSYVVPIDGSEAGEKIVPIAAAWAIEFGAVPWLVEVIDPDLRLSGDISETAYPARIAHRIQAQTGHEVEYDVLHGDHPSRSIVEFAERMKASLIFACTHGRTGLERLRLGSVAAEIVRHADCPVVLHRPPTIK